jgi:squalene synthase HpnC
MAVDHYENFPVASVLLPQRFRRPVVLIYRFAREADDIADEGAASVSERLRELQDFRDEILRIEAGAEPRIRWFSELAQVVHAHDLPTKAFLDLLSAFEQDVTRHRYRRFQELMDYCSRSANPVGHLLLQLYGAREAQHREWSDAICSSLQLINFLQDVPVDYAKGRIYLPAEEMEDYGVSEAQIAAADTGGGWQRFMRFQTARARALLASGAPLGRALKGRLGLEMRMILAGGTRILDKIDARGGDVFRQRPVLRTYDWPLMLLRAL